MPAGKEYGRKKYYPHKRARPHFRRSDKAIETSLRHEGRRTISEYLAVEHPRTARKQRFHYVARLRGSRPHDFYHGAGTIADSAAQSFSAWTGAEVTLQPTDELGHYRASWFDPHSEQFRETAFVIVEEADPRAPRLR